jgi:iron complex outermembrane receptor protein
VTSAGDPPVNPETLDAYETGVKTTLFDNRLRLNNSVYYYKYNNIQLISQVGAAQLLLNAAKAQIYGLDNDFDAALTDRLALRGGFSYVHGRYGEFPNAPYYIPNTPPAVGNTVVARSGEGNHTVFTPTFTGNMAADYRYPLSYGEISTNISYYYNSGFYFTPDNTVRQGSYSLVNAAITWTAPSKNYNVRLWARNLFDTRYLLSGFQGQVGNTVVAAPGGMFGVAVGVDF